MKKITNILLITLIILSSFFILFNTKVFAAGSITLSSNKSKVAPGEEFTITATLSGVSLASYTVRVNVDTSKVDYVSGTGNSSFSGGRAITTWTDPSGGSSPVSSGAIAKFTFRAKSTGSATFSVGGDFFKPDYSDAGPSFSGTSVTIEQTATTTPPPQPTNTTNNTTTPSVTNTQSNNNSSSSTNKNTTTSNQSTTSSKLSSNANLKSLRVDKEGLSPSFKSSTTKYSIVVDKDVNTLDVLAETENSNAKIDISGNSNLQIGLNTINVTVTAQDGTKKTYSIDVTKTENLELSNANLENLAVENVILAPEFDPTITEYSSGVPQDFQNPHILAIPQRQNAKVDIIGADNPINDGDNIITINVTAEDGITVKTYTINLYKNHEEELIEAIQEEAQEISKANVAIPIFIISVSVLSGCSYLIYVYKFKR